MGFTLGEVVPWGRSYDEYVAMFALTDTDLRRRILGCGDGPASFNAVLTGRGGSVVSVDPLYRYSRDEIRQRIDETYCVVMEQTRKNAHEFLWTTITSVEELGRLRLAAMESFLSDYRLGRGAEALCHGGTSQSSLRGPGVRSRRLLASALPLQRTPL